MPCNSASVPTAAGCCRPASVATTRAPAAWSAPIAPPPAHTLKVGPAACDYLRGMMGHLPLPEAPPDAATQQDLERLLHLHLTTCLGREIKSYPFLYL